MATKKVSPKLAVYVAEGDAETSVRQLASVIGSVRCCRLGNVTSDSWESYGYLIIGGALAEGSAAADLSGFVTSNLDRLQDKQLAFFA